MTTINKYIKISEYNWKKIKHDFFPDKIVIYPDIKISDDKLLWNKLDTKIEIIFSELKNDTNNLEKYTGPTGYVGSYGYIRSEEYKSTLPIYLDTEQFIKDNINSTLPTGFYGTDSTVITDREITIEFIKKIEEIKNGYLLG